MTYTMTIKNTLKKYNLLNNFPKKYLETLSKSIDYSLEVFDNNILSITLGGSCGKNHIHEGWSDIDLYFVLKEYDIKTIIKYNDLIDNLNGITVSANFYTLKEVEKNMVSMKTKIMIYEKYKYDLNPNIYGDNYFKPVTYETIRSNDINNLPNILQEYKKMIILLKTSNAKLSRYYIKKMLILLKCVLNYHNIFSFGYEEVILKFTRLCNDFKYPLTKKSGIDILIIIDDYENIEKYKNQIIDFSEEIFEFIYQYC